MFEGLEYYNSILYFLNGKLVFMKPGKDQSLYVYK